MRGVWKIAPGESAYLWEDSFEGGYISINWENKKDFSKFTREQIKNLVGEKATKCIWAFVSDIQEGQTVVANKGTRKVVGIGKIKSAYLPPNHPDNPRAKKRESKHRHVHLVEWQINGEIELETEFFGRIPPAVKQLTPEQCQQIKDAYLEKDPSLKGKLDQLLPDDLETGETKVIEPTEGTTMIELLEQLRQIILYGPPGTGKTREAKRVALGVLKGTATKEELPDDDVVLQLEEFRKAGRFDIVVFHPAYEYEQFVGGIGPNVEGEGLGFQVKMGPFLKLCRAAGRTDQPVVLLIDEINRGHLPKLLGELVYSLEYRGEKVRLPFSCDGRDELVIPDNLFVIGTMNSSDRSIGHIDVAIRRRFGLVPFGPDSEVVRKIWLKHDADFGKSLTDLMETVNMKLRAHDTSAAEELGVGQSYFLPAEGSSTAKAKQQVQLKWEYQVIPLLKEYAQLLSTGDSLEEFFKPLDNCLP